MRFDPSKTRYGLIPRWFLKRLADRYALGAEKYGDFGWADETDPDVFGEKAIRHLFQLLDGETDEDHAAAVVCNVIAFAHISEKRRDTLAGGASGSGEAGQR